ncbi:MAG: hypothetical protein AAGF32_01420 [Pseudomonadota bacterium]
MKAFVFAALAVVVISVGANYALTSMDWSSANTYATDNVRLGQ